MIYSMLDLRKGTSRFVLYKWRYDVLKGAVCGLTSDRNYLCTLSVGTFCSTNNILNRVHLTLLCLASLRVNSPTNDTVKDLYPLVHDGRNARFGKNL